MIRIMAEFKLLLLLVLVYSASLLAAAYAISFSVAVIFMVRRGYFYYPLESFTFASKVGVVAGLTAGLTAWVACKLRELWQR
ncbi:hypothetical protein PTE30175_00969 [Pandoraea terrae]|uniref:Uncharacterized protein n=1 Tax=Pandoraea terrae TaxID=1537710 RepID=A0A5E4SWS1_9BURK|nr:hypothetical protein PTE30175_00969 [Pandoraea terrae]